ncbi:MAG: hypothetical protein CDV28_11310 [Candidatus Electronema aureum]|uniref:Uncharacterized protein n=1 Tax=Candidatus Electronema aureum TaxID=2005002 RepID=A0A521G1T4_9BACT|nr:MAG: hypothetical protein CDV28_11310 [Candidatus Electronema aureum]
MLLTRYAKTLGLLLLLPLGWGLSLLPLLLVWPHLKFQLLLPALAVWAALYILPFPFLLRLIIHKVWFFHRHGEPVLQEMLEFMLLGINEIPNPVRAEKKGKKIRLSWHCDDPTWCRWMALARLRQQYELTLEFDTATRTVIMRDRVRAVDFSLCPVKVSFGLLTSTRFFCHVRSGPEWGISAFEQTTTENWRFKPQELKTPIFNTIIRNGWNVRFELY